MLGLKIVYIERCLNTKAQDDTMLCGFTANTLRLLSVYELKNMLNVFVLFEKQKQLQTNLKVKSTPQTKSKIVLGCFIV